MAEENQLGKNKNHKKSSSSSSTNADFKAIIKLSMEKLLPELQETR